jgi:Na+-transporting methylmalonyl-CoA/oxaloacetate decarboxylase gamma subunit
VEDEWVVEKTVVKSVFLLSGIEEPHNENTTMKPVVVTLSPCCYAAVVVAVVAGDRKEQGKCWLENTVTTSLVRLVEDLMMMMMGITFALLLMLLLLHHEIVEAILREFLLEFAEQCQQMKWDRDTVAAVAGVAPAVVVAVLAVSSGRMKFACYLLWELT